MVACFVVLFGLTIQAQDPVHIPLAVSHALRSADPVYLSTPIPEYWQQDSLSRIQDALNLVDTIPLRSPSPALTDSMLWGHHRRIIQVELAPEHGFS